MQKELHLDCILYFSSLDVYADTIVNIINLFVQVEAILRPINLSIETSVDLLAGRPEEKPRLRLAEILHKPTLFLDLSVAPPVVSLIKLPANQLAEIPPERPAKSLYQPALFPLIIPQRN